MKLIIITGAPASGKSSIADSISKQLGIDIVSKDEIKIELFEKFGFTNHAEKKKLSIKSESIMYDTIDHYIKQNLDLIVDNNFKHFNAIRDILKGTNAHVEVKCIYCIANYDILAKRYNERISSGNRHLALYTLNQYPVIDGVSEFHPLITKNDVERIEKEIKEYTFGENVLEINTDNIEFEFESLCDKVIKFIG